VTCAEAANRASYAAYSDTADAWHEAIVALGRCQTAQGAATAAVTAQVDG
jgi:hypothetical protein